MHSQVQFDSKDKDSYFIKIAEYDLSTFNMPGLHSKSGSLLNLDSNLTLTVNSGKPFAYNKHNKTLKIIDIPSIIPGAASRWNRPSKNASYIFASDGNGNGFWLKHDFSLTYFIPISSYHFSLVRILTSKNSILQFTGGDEKRFGDSRWYFELYDLAIKKPLSFSQQTSWALAISEELFNGSYTLLVESSKFYFRISPTSRKIETVRKEGLSKLNIEQTLPSWFKPVDTTIQVYSRSSKFELNPDQILEGQNTILQNATLPFRAGIVNSNNGEYLLVYSQPFKQPGLSNKVEQNAKYRIGIVDCYRVDNENETLNFTNSITIKLFSDYIYFPSIKEMPIIHEIDKSGIYIARSKNYQFYGLSIPGPVIEHYSFVLQ